MFTAACWCMGRQSGLRPLEQKGLDQVHLQCSLLQLREHFLCVKRDRANLGKVPANVCTQNQPHCKRQLGTETGLK